jgi:hypothetical protein
MCVLFPIKLFLHDLTFTFVPQLSQSPYNLTPQSIRLANSRSPSDPVASLTLPTVQNTCLPGPPLSNSISYFTQSSGRPQTGPVTLITLPYSYGLLHTLATTDPAAAVTLPYWLGLLLTWSPTVPAIWCFLAGSPKAWTVMASWTSVSSLGNLKWDSCTRS